MRQEIIDQVLGLPLRERRALLHRFAGRGARAGRLSPEPRTGRFPASAGQRSQWFLWRLDPGGSAYNIPVLYRVRGDLRTGVLERALGELTVRHEALRTTFAETDDGLEQVVGAPREVEIARHTAPAGLVPLAERIRAFAEAPFDLGGGPLFRAALWSGDDGHVLALCFHHAVFDEWSLGVLERDLGSLYNTLLAGREPAPPVPRLQVADLPSASEDGLDHWTRTLEGVRPTSPPWDQPPERDGGPAGYQTATIPPDVLAGVDALARAHGTTRFAVLLAAFHVFLIRRTGRTDLSVGTPVAGRTRPETRDLIGFLVNTLVLRTHVATDQPFAALVDRTTRTLREALRHQDVPFETVVRALGGAHDPARNPLFRVMFTRADAPDTDGGDALDLHGASAHPMAPQEGQALFDLTVTVTEGPEGTALTYEYAADRYLEETVRGWAVEQVDLLHRITAAPDTPVSALLPARDRDANVRVRGEERPAPRDTVPEMIARRARDTPGTVAIHEGRHTLTYADVAVRAAALAARLRAHGAGPERLVAVALPTGADAVTAVLACWWSGAAFVPFAPDDPLERSRGMADRLDVCAVIVPPGHRPLGDHPAPVVEYAPSDGFAPTSADGPPPSLPPRPVRPSQLAYVIHTSGSTGTPKGVMIQHDHLAEHTVNGLAPLLGDAAGRPLNVALGAAAVFDVFVNQLVSLALGHTLVVLDGPSRTDPRRLADALRNGPRVDVLDQPPALLPLLLDTGVLDTPRAPHTLLFGGEPCPPEVWDRLRGHPGVRALNCYGPTECTIDATTADVARTRAVTVGVPHPNTTVHVLDEHLRPLPAGAVGEVYLGGPRVGRGYAHAPGLTAARFLPDPFTPGGRLYRTGDQGRLRSDGSLEFRGRLDRQVQIRGRRIELAEVEEALAGLPGVRAAVAVAHRAPNGTDIRAYAMADTEPSALRSALARRLPRHMLPTDLVVVDRFPLTPSGKIDTARLPEPPHRPAGPAADAPRDDRERTIARAWCDVLGLEGVGIFDDFFDLGGHSLLAVRLAAALEERTGRPVQADLVLTEPTVASQARSLARADDDTRVVVPMGGTVGAGGPVTVLVHPVGGSLLCYRRLAQSLARTGEVVGLRADVRGRTVPLPDPVTGLRPLAARYAALLTEELPGRSLVLMGWSLGGALAQAVAAELVRQGRAPEHLVLLDTPPPAGETEEDREVAALLTGLATGVPVDRGFHGAALRSLGVDPDGFAALPPGARADLAGFWSALLGASLRHRPEALAIPTTLVLPHVHDEATATWAARGWASSNPGGPNVQRVPGDHFSLLDGLADTAPVWLTDPGRGTPAARGHVQAARTAAHTQASTEVGE